MTIGKELFRLRTLKGVSLRKVEDETGISNAYLSQLETGKTDKPSPGILHKLADYYGAEYMDLLKESGYLTVREQQAPKKVSDIESALMSAKLEPEKEQLVVEFIEFLGSRKTG
jgi:transcriptional regulator with XRE-family HTH domain